MGVIANNGKEIEVPDGEMIQLYCEEIDVPFGCRSGLCGTCRIEVLEGMGNLSEKNDEEEDMDLEEGVRLACQCTLQQGRVVVHPVD